MDVPKTGSAPQTQPVEVLLGAEASDRLWPQFGIFSPDDRTLYWLSYDNSKVVVYDAANRKQLPAIDRPSGPPIDLSISPRSGKLVIADSKFRIAVVDPGTGKSFSVDFLNGPTPSISVTADERRLLAASIGYVRAYDFETGQPLWSRVRQAGDVKMQPDGFPEPVTLPDGAAGNAFTSDGRVVVTSSRNEAFIYRMPATTEDVVDVACRRLLALDDPALPPAGGISASERLAAPCIDAKQAPLTEREAWEDLRRMALFLLNVLGSLVLHPSGTGGT
jgi:hypothetical protein